MNNIVNNSIEAITNVEKDVKAKKWMDVLVGLVVLAVSLLVTALLGQTLWNNSVPKLFPMLRKAGLYEVLSLHLLLKMLLN